MSYIKHFKEAKKGPLSCTFYYKVLSRSSIKILDRRITKITAATIITANTVTAFNKTTVGVTGSVTATVALVMSARN